MYNTEYLNLKKEIPILKSHTLCIVKILYDLNHDLRPKLSQMRSSMFNIYIEKKIIIWDTIFSAITMRGSQCRCKTCKMVQTVNQGL